MFYLSEFHTKQDLVLKYHILQLYLQCNRIVKLWEFYRSHPSSGNKQSLHIVSFSALCMRSRPSAGHTTKCSLFAIPWLQFSSFVTPANISSLDVLSKEYCMYGLSVSDDDSFWYAVKFSECCSDKGINCSFDARCTSTTLLGKNSNYTWIIF